MRVAGGKAKGLQLKGPVTSGTRATTERARSAIFNILYGGLYQGARVLDLFAGCGSLGIEALSRGAAWADFVEWDRRQCQVIQSNLHATAFDSFARVHCSDVNHNFANLPGSYRLILLDPPYGMEDLAGVMVKLGEGTGLLAEGGVVVVGHSRFLDLTEEYGSLRQFSHRRYGDNVVDFYENTGAKTGSEDIKQSRASDEAGRQ